jgi:hypothetical protein
VQSRPPNRRRFLCKKHFDFTSEIALIGVKCTQQYGRGRGCFAIVVQEERRTEGRGTARWGYLTRPIRVLGIGFDLSASTPEMPSGSMASLTFCVKPAIPERRTLRLFAPRSKSFTTCWRGAPVRKSSSSSLIERPIACSHPSTGHRGCRFPDGRSNVRVADAAVAGNTLP